MRILHVAPLYHPAMGGAETYVKQVSERLSRRGHDVTVLTTNSGGGSDELDHQLRSTEIVNGVTVERFRPAKRSQKLFNAALTVRGVHRVLGWTIGLDTVQMLAVGPQTVAPYRHAMKQHDVVGVSNWYCSVLPYQLCLARRRRSFALVGMPLFHTERSWTSSPMYDRMLQCCDAVLAMTEHEKRFVNARSPHDNTHVVGAGIDPCGFVSADGATLRAHHGIGDAPLVGYVGRMTVAKGLITLIDAMRTVWAAYPRARLLIAGFNPAAGRAHDDVAASLSALPPAERARIIVIDSFDEREKASIFDALDVFAMPSGAESFGIAYLEAWMRRKPVIGCRIGATECVIDDGVDGILTAPGSAADVASAIRRLLSSRELRDRMGNAGHVKTMSQFTWDRITDKVERVYEHAHLAASRERVEGGRIN
jgi:glycosyltransferase involved in cell wall biosynthesis